MTTKIQVVEREIEQTREAQDAAQREATTATGDALSKVGAVLAGLGAKMRGLQGQRDDLAATQADAQARREVAEREKQHADAVAAIRARQQDLTERKIRWVADMEAIEDHVAALWGELATVNAAIRDLHADARALGIQAPVTVATPERVRAVGLDRSPYLKWVRRP